MRFKVSRGVPAIALATLLALLSTAARPQQIARARAVVRRIVGLNYPYLAHLAGTAGKVDLIAEISRGGAVESMRVASGDQLLADAAKGALSRWLFSCTEPNQGCEARVRFTFTLLDGQCDPGRDCPSEFQIDLPSSVTITSKHLPAIVN